MGKVAYRASGICLFLIFYHAGFCQETPLKAYIDAYNQSSEYNVFYEDFWIPDVKVSASNNSFEAFTTTIQENGLEFFIYQDIYLFIYPNDVELERLRILSSADPGFDSMDYIRIGKISPIDTSKIYQLTGQVLDDESNPLVNATVYVNSTENGTQTNTNGRYTLDLKQGNYEVEYRYSGLMTEVKKITIYQSGSYDLTLFTDTRLLDEVIIESRSEFETSGDLAIGQSSISIETIRELPSLLGESDIIKGITMLPGITTAGESSSNLNIRGGKNDQTLILMNRSPILTPGHLFGFFSVFNNEFVSDVNIYKGNIPARYGMRASSVLDVEMNNWAKNPLEVYGSIGLAKSNLGVKAKLFDNKMDIHIGGRKSYIDWLLASIPDQNIVESRASFGDANFSTQYLLNEKNTIRASAYYGSDYFKYANSIIYQWESINGNLEWVHAFDNDWLFNSEVVFSLFDNDAEGIEPNNQYLLSSSVDSYSWTNELTKEFESFQIAAGAEVSNYRLDAGNFQPLAENTSDQPQQMDNELLWTYNAYVDGVIHLSEELAITPGVRLTTYQSFGADTVFNYQSGQPKSDQTIEDFENFGAGEVTHQSFAIEPRLGMSYTLNSHTFKLGFTQTNQFMHLLSNTSLVNPTNIWKGVDTYIKPTTISQYSLGYVKELKNQNINISVEGYFKRSNNLIEYKNGADLLLNERIEQDVLYGTGNSYGFEVFTSKKYGKLNWWMSYTYSRSFVQVTSDFEEETINDGKFYPYYSDRPHSFLLSLDFNPSKKWSFTSNFTYTSGAPTTVPEYIYQIDGINIPHFGERNSYRIPDYHRLDLAVVYKNRIRKTKKIRDRWVFSVYNVYGRSNVTSVFFSRDGTLPARPFKFISVGQMIPTMTYEFEF